MKELLLSLGIDLASNTIYDFIHSKLKEGVSQTELVNDLNHFLLIHGQEIEAEKIISFMATEGQLIIRDSTIYSAQSIIMASSQNGSFEFTNSSSATPATKIVSGANVSMLGRGNVSVRQNADGTIEFGSN